MTHFPKTELENYFCRSLSLTLITLALVTLVLTGSVPLTSSSFAESICSSSSSPYFFPFLFLFLPIPPLPLPPFAKTRLLTPLGPTQLLLQPLISSLFRLSSLPPPSTRSPLSTPICSIQILSKMLLPLVSQARGY